MKKIIIRTLGGKGIGYGHFYRCLSLAKSIRLIDEDINIIFIINEELVDLIENSGFDFIVSKDLYEDYVIIEKRSSDLFIFDSYLGDNEYLRKIKEKIKLMLIDDNNDIYDSSIPDIIYNGNIHAEDLGYNNVEGQIRMLGSKYLIMKEEYWSNEVSLLPNDGILITTGGTDDYWITLSVINAIKDLDIRIRVIIGPGYNDHYIKEIEDIRTRNVELIYKPNSLKEYIASSKAVITAGGSTIYEILSQKSIPIVFSMADNQDLVCKVLNQMGVEYLGKYPNIDYSRLGELIERLQNKEIDENNEIFSLVNIKGAIFTANILIYQINE